MNELMQIWQTQLANISPHPASSRKCRSSNQVVWLWLKARYMATVLAFKCIGLSFPPLEFQCMDGIATWTLCREYFSPGLDILVHPGPSLHAKHILSMMQMKDVCVVLKSSCCGQKKPKSICEIESFNEDILSQSDEKWNEWAFMTCLSFKCYYVCKRNPLMNGSWQFSLYVEIWRKFLLPLHVS